MGTRLQPVATNVDWMSPWNQAAQNILRAGEIEAGGDAALGAGIRGGLLSVGAAVSRRKAEAKAKAENDRRLQEDIFRDRRDYDFRTTQANVWMVKDKIEAADLEVQQATALLALRPDDPALQKMLTDATAKKELAADAIKVNVERLLKYAPQNVTPATQITDPAECAADPSKPG